MRRLIAAILVLGSLTQPALAEGRSRLGYGRIVSNDFIGDLQDRWQTGSLQSSRVWGHGWTGQAPARPLDLLELRLSGQIIAPDDLGRPAAGDRPYATALSAGLHTHFTEGAAEVAAGIDMVVTGDGTGLRWLQDSLHDLLGVRGTSARTRAGDIGGGLHPTVVVEAGRSYGPGRTRLRPFAEVRYGIESMVRAGIDLEIGPAGQGELMARDAVTGHRYRVIRRPGRGVTFVAGADVARVFDSTYLPGPAYRLTDARTRLRAGVHVEGRRARGFYGITWLGPEFRGQPEGQLVGSARIDIDF